MRYSEKVIEHYTNPRNVGRLDTGSKNVGTGMAGVSGCGDVIRVQIEVDEVSGIITEAKFKTFGSGAAIASSSLVTEWLKKKSMEDALKIERMDIVEELNLPMIKIHCAVLVEDAVKAAIGDYRQKQGLKEMILTEIN